MQRKIIHIDMDAFYASVEQRDFPEYRNKPLVVGGPVEGRGGVVATASYEARQYGIHSAMSSKMAKRLCPQAIFVFPRFEVYKKVSEHIHEIFHRFTDMVEPLSLDEAFLDVTQDKLNVGLAIEIANQIKQSIKDELNLTASAGVSVNKFIAKVASAMNKPNGLTFIGPSKIEAFMEQLPVESFFGVGKVTAAKMNTMGLHIGKDIKAWSEPDLIQHFGKSGKFYYQIVRGIDHRPVRSNRVVKSVSVEDTFSEDLTSKEEMLFEFQKLVGRLFMRLERHHLRGKTITLKFKFHDFSQMTRSLTEQSALEHQDKIMQAVHKIFNPLDFSDKKIRLLGIGISNFETAIKKASRSKRPIIQLELFDWEVYE